MAKRKVVAPSSAEEKRINAGIKSDPDTAEATEEDFARAKPAPKKMQELTKRYRGKQKAPTKVPVHIRLDQKVVDAYKATGSGWQSRVNDDLAAIVSKRTAVHKARKAATHAAAKAKRPSGKAGKTVSSKKMPRSQKKAG